MPATINGIGTHYYGAQNRSARVDTCKFCRRSATLSSYDTREWFCVIFIPVIPMRKFRILTREFCIEEGELTATMKVRRMRVLENFRDHIEELYAGKEESH